MRLEGEGWGSETSCEEGNVRKTEGEGKLLLGRIDCIEGLVIDVARKTWFLSEVWVGYREKTNLI